jgi:histidinol dehydrogenase
MEDDLRKAITAAQEQNIPIKDICFSGSGEPTLSPNFKEALISANKILKETTPSSQMVIITNGTGLQQSEVFSLLKETAANSSLDIWLKLDAGTAGWYQKINRTTLPYEQLIEKIKDFTACTPVTIQTMLCAVEGKTPSIEETKSWEALITELAATQTGIRKVQLYGKARSAPEDPLASELPAEYLEERASSLRGIFAEKGITTPVEVYY